MKKLLDWNYNPVLFCAVFYYKQTIKIWKCFFVEGYDPKYWTF